MFQKRNGYGSRRLGRSRRGGHYVHVTKAATATEIRRALGITRRHSRVVIKALREVGLEVAP